MHLYLLYLCLSYLLFCLLRLCLCFSFFHFYLYLLYPYICLNCLLIRLHLLCLYVYLGYLLFYLLRLCLYLDFLLFCCHLLCQGLDYTFYHFLDSFSYKRVGQCGIIIKKLFSENVILIFTLLFSEFLFFPFFLFYNISKKLSFKTKILKNNIVKERIQKI